MRISLLLLTTLIMSASTAVCQSFTFVTIEGKVKNGSPADSIVIYIRDILFFPFRERIEIDNNGRFHKEISIAPNTDISLEFNDSEQINLYTGNRSGIQLEWDKNNFPASVHSLAPDDPINRFLISYQQQFPDIREQLDTVTSLERVISMVRKQNDSAFTFLKQAGTQLDDIAYKKCATDIFYRNLSAIITSERFKGFDFSDAAQTAEFPFITFFDKRFDSLQNVSFQRMKSASSTASLQILENASRSETEWDFRTNYSVLNASALYQSENYRNFLSQYFEQFLLTIYNRKLGKDAQQSTYQYANLLHAFTDNQKITNWLIACRIRNKVAFNDINSFPETAFKKELSLVQDSALTDQLTKYYNLFAHLKKGIKAPVITFSTENGQLDSTTRYKGKYLFIDVWSSYCAPCIAEISRHSENVANKLKGKNVVLLYISLDSNRKLWLDAIRKYKPAGVNVLATAGLDSQFVKDFGVFSIPRHILISPEGIIEDASFPGLFELTDTLFLK